MNARSLLIVSLGANIALLGLVAYQFKKQPASGGAARPPSAAEMTAPPPAAAAKPPSEPIQPRAAGAEPFDWRLVESEDYRQYIANLRAIGCPEETIRDIIIADVNKLFESRRKEVLGLTNKFEFWKTGNPFAQLVSVERIEKQQALDREKREVIRALLGVDVPEQPDMFGAFRPMTEQMLDFLPAHKQNQILELEQKYQLKMMKSVSSGIPDTEDMKAVKEAQEQKDAELAALLTPEEKENYDLRMSQTAMMMRMQLDGFDPTEEEFREIFEVRKEFDDEYSPLMGGGFGSSEHQQKRAEAERQMNDQIKELLGEDRFKEYQREQDWTFKGIAKVAERQGLEKDAAVKVYEMKRLAEEQAAKLRTDSSIDRGKQQEALRQIRAETEAAIAKTLGEQGFESLRDQPTAHWLRAISPDPPKEAPPSAVPVP